MRVCSVFIIGFFVLLSGCNRASEIKVYRVSKAPLEEIAASQQNAMPTNEGSPSAPGAMAPVSAPSAVVPAPPNWEPQPPSQMRKASFLVHGDNGATADISLV